jgi:ABC-type sugar transport system permease subunit
LAIGWLWIFDSIYSIINWTARAIGLFGPGTWPIWLGDPTLAKVSIIVLNVWRLLPLATIIILAGLTSIPSDIHDAAQVDGAGFWRRHFQITAPLLMPITVVALLFGVIFTFTDMIVVFVLTRGGPCDQTQVIASWAYFTGIQGRRSCRRRGHLAVHVPGAGRGRDPVPAFRAPCRGDLTWHRPGDACSASPKPAATPSCWYSL